MVETPTGTLAIKLEWVRWGGGVTACMTLYGPDGWPASTRSWGERYSQALDSDESRTLPQVISNWTGMPSLDAEAFVDETLARWRRSSSFEDDVKISRRSMQLIAALAVVAALALVGAAALAWLVVSALT